MAGIPGSGKSTAAEVLTQRFGAEGYDVIFRTDKAVLDEKVAEDVFRFENDEGRYLDGALVGEHSILLNPESPQGLFQVRFVDAHALNTAHTTLLERVAAFHQENTDPKKLLIVELAYGKDSKPFYDGSVIRQTGTQYMEWFTQYGMLPHLAMLDVVSSFEVRLARNLARDTHKIPEEVFRELFPEEGHFTQSEIKMFGSRYWRIDNLGLTPAELERYAGEVHMLYEQHILPFVREGFPPQSAEGASRGGPRLEMR